MSVFSRLRRFLPGSTAARLFVAAAALVPVLGTAQGAALSPPERAVIFEQVWRLIDEKYYDASFNGVDWKQVHDHYRVRLVSIKSDSDFYVLLKQMTAELHDAHTRFRSPDERRRADNLESVNLGLGVGEVNGSPVVISIEPRSEAEEAGIQPGMILDTIDGRAFSDQVARAQLEIGSSSSGRATALLSYAWLLSGEPNTSVRLGLIRPDGSRFDTILTRRLVPRSPPAQPKILPSGYLYFRLPVFDDESANQLRRMLTQNKDAPGLILDLRGNTGGDFRAVLSAADNFFPERASLGRVIGRSGKQPSLILRMLGVPASLNVGNTGENAYNGPVVILVNEGSASGAELFAAGMQENKRAAIVGRQTCGCLLATIHHKIKGGGELDVSEFNVLTAKGRRLEGDGVIPDVPVPLTLEDLRDRHDATIRQAVAILHTSLNRRAEQ